MKKTLITLTCLVALYGANFVGAEETVPLNSLNLRLMTTGYGGVNKNKSSSGNPITLKGNTYQGIGTHAESRLILQLDGKGEKFTSLVGIDDNAGGNPRVIFRVIGDGKVLFDSGVMKLGDDPKKIDVSLKGLKMITLEAVPAEEGQINNAHVNWAEPVIIMSSGKPVPRPEGEIVQIETDNTMIALRVDKEGHVFQQYLGSKDGSVFSGGANKDLWYPTIMSTGEFQFWGDPALHVIHADGHMNTVLKFQKQQTAIQTDGSVLTTVTLKDPNYEFYMDVFYKSHPKLDVIEQWTEITHKEKGAVVLKDFDSAAFTFHGGQYWLTYFTGPWMNEFGVNEEKLTKGSKVLENKWGITSSNERQPHFMLSIGGKATEKEGKVLAASFAWSGNYRMQFEQQNNGSMVVSTGMNPWASSYTLTPGKVFRTPKVIYTYSEQGKGEASRRLHRWARVHGMRDGDTPLRTIFNNWEATGMDTSDKRIVPFFKPAKELGFELFLLDDGWFGLPNKARVLGEWEPSPVRHPQGMKVLIEEAGKAGIDFGLWVEMEMANPDARLVTEHPDWLLTEPNRPKHLQRGQYVLDLANPAVQDFCIKAFNKILKDYPGISFVKWDCNSPFHNPYSKYLGNKQEHLWINYTLGLYRIFNETVKANPKLQMMLCSAGGARCDYGALRFFHEFWASDNTNAHRRVFIQWGYSHIFPAKAVGAHVTHMGRLPFKFAFDVAMSGTLGMDADPTRMTEEEKMVTKRAVAVYKEKLRDVVQMGDVYRLISPYENSRASLMYVSEKKDKAVVFVYQVEDGKDEPVIKLEGLEPGKTYTVEEVNIDSPETAACRENGKSISGKELMEKGLSFSCKKRLDSAVVYLSAK